MAIFSVGEVQLMCCGPVTAFLESKHRTESADCLRRQWFLDCGAHWKGISEVLSTC